MNSVIWTFFTIMSRTAIWTWEMNSTWEKILLLLPLWSDFDLILNHLRTLQIVVLGKGSILIENDSEVHAEVVAVGTFEPSEPPWSGRGTVEIMKIYDYDWWSNNRTRFWTTWRKYFLEIGLKLILDYLTFSI